MTTITDIDYMDWIAIKTGASHLGRTPSKETKKLLETPARKGFKMPHNCKQYSTNYCSLRNKLLAAAKAHNIKIQTNHVGGEFVVFRLS